VLFAPESELAGMTSFRGWQLRTHEIKTLPTKYEQQIAQTMQVLTHVAQAIETGRYDYVACGQTPAAAVLAVNWIEAGNTPTEDLQFVGDAKSCVSWPVGAVLGALRVGKDEAEAAGLYTRAAGILSANKADIAKLYPIQFSVMVARRDSSEHLAKVVRTLAQLAVPDPPLVLAMVGLAR
jgi:hypothetical protein